MPCLARLWWERPGCPQKLPWYLSSLTLSLLSRPGSSTSFFPEWWTPSQSLQDPSTNSDPGWIGVIIWFNRQGWQVGDAQICPSDCTKWSQIQLLMWYPGYWQFPYCDLILLCNLVVEISLLVKFPLMFTEDEFFPSRWITNTPPPKLCVVSTASSIREKAIWQTHLS